MLKQTLIFSLLCSLLPGTVQAGGDSTEAQLVKSLQAINNNRLDIALNEVDSLLRVNPNFKLAQLVKGDLLMAHAGVIDNFGSASNAPQDKIEDLRDEARVRLTTRAVPIRHQAQTRIFYGNWMRDRSMRW